MGWGLQKYTYPTGTSSESSLKVMQSKHIGYLTNRLYTKIIYSYCEAIGFYSVGFCDAIQTLV